MVEVASPKPLSPGLRCAGFVLPWWVRGAPGGVCNGHPEQRGTSSAADRDLSTWAGSDRVSVLLTPSLLSCG